MDSIGRQLDGVEKRTPMAWQHRDINYHQGGYHDKYRVQPSIIPRPSPVSTSDRLSHHTDKSWKGGPYPNGVPSSTPYGGAQYPPSRPSFSSGRPASPQHSPDPTSPSSSSSSSEDDSDPEGQRSQIEQPPPQALYGYGAFYPPFNPQYGPPMPHMPPQGYPGTLKSAKSVPALPINTWDGEPCPVHGNGGPLSLPGMVPPMMGPPPPMMPPMGPPMAGPHKRAASIYDMRMMSPPPGPIYGTLPNPSKGGSGGGSDRRSAILASNGIPPHLLPPMVRPRPMVVSEDGLAEPLPVRSPVDKAELLPPKGSGESDGETKGRLCTRGAACVSWIIVGVICAGVVLALLLLFIL